ncbi:MAG: M36 family metallopeptidase [Thermoanaerobaculia bacterium]
MGEHAVRDVLEHRRRARLRSDLYNGTGGNNQRLSARDRRNEAATLLAPGFVDGRDAILAANEVNYDGDFYCAIWNAFAKRGVGVSARARVRTTSWETRSRRSMFLRSAPV